MLELQRGHVVCLNSILSQSPIPGAIDYCTSKSSSLAFMESLTLGLLDCPGVGCTTVLPFHTSTEMFQGMRVRCAQLFVLTICYQLTNSTCTAWFYWFFRALKPFCFLGSPSSSHLSDQRWSLRGLWRPSELTRLFCTCLGRCTPLSSSKGKLKKESTSRFLFYSFQQNSCYLVINIVFLVFFVLASCHKLHLKRSRGFLGVTPA